MTPALLAKKLKSALVSRMRAARAWLRDGRPLWWWLAGAAILVVVPLVVPAVEATAADRLRWSGIFLQFAGLATVVRGLNESRKLFMKPSVWRASVAWLGRLRYVIVPRPVASASGNLKAGAAFIASGTAVKASATSGKSVEDRLASLEAGLSAIERRIGQAESDAREFRGQVDGRLDREGAERREGDERIGRQLETAIIGGIDLEVSGLAFLFLGIALASAPDDALWLFQVAFAWLI